MARKRVSEMTSEEHEAWKAKQRAAYAKNPGPYKAAMKRWKDAHREHYNEYHRLYQQRPEVKAKVKVYHSTPEYRMKAAAYARGYHAGFRRAKMIAQSLIHCLGTSFDLATKKK